MCVKSIDDKRKHWRYVADTHLIEKEEGQTEEICVLYENYLLSPHAIAAVMNATSGFRETPIQAEEIRAWFDNEGKSGKYIKPHHQLQLNELSSFTRMRNASLTSWSLSFTPMTTPAFA